MNDSLTGSQIAGYRVERLLGRGGMASVYFAWDTKNDRAVALKVMDERYRQTASYVDRFIHEAQTMIGWNHPHIVRVYDAGEENKVYYYAMEFIRGLDLAQLLRQYQDAGQLMPFDDVVRIGWAMGEALDYAHSNGIIHRDVKPSNILVSVDGRILLSDFGLVMDVNRGTLGETFGSPAYIAPEQARSSAGAVPQSDIYALGVILYEMLVGVVPFYDASPTSLALKHLTEEPPRPRALNPRLNPSVEAVLLRALRKSPADRYASGREMLSALERALGDALQSQDATTPHPMPNQTQVLRTERAHPQPQQQSQGRPAGDPRPQRLPPQPAAQAPRAETRRAAPQPPAYGATAVQPAAPRSQVTSRVPASPPPYQPASSAGSYGAPPLPPAQKKRGGYGWGCLTAVLALGALAIVLGTVFAMNRPALGLFPWLGQPTENPLPEATLPPLVPPTLTVTATLEPSPEPSATLEPSPTLTSTATETLVPTPTDTPVPPTETPTATPEPFFNLLLASSNDNGFILANTSEEPFPLELLDLRSRDRDEPRLLATDWELEFLEPGECVFAWVEDNRARLPSGVECEEVGDVLRFDRSERFWLEPVEVYFEGVRVETCEVRENRCEFDTRPEE